MLYDYECAKCGKIEIDRKLDEEIKKCPECGSKIKRLYFPVSAVFKGKGFYKTDHK